MFCACCGIIIFAVYMSLCEGKIGEYCGEAQRKAVFEAQKIVIKPQKRGLRQILVKRQLCQMSKKRGFGEARGRECCGKAQRIEGCVADR